ncbi:hypothetical protein [Duganella sp. P38]|uniref:hypothetical protein n=1 Tax=Duganella sp. P38 TaxID=3423949 RepID=UPI003D7B9D45
MNRSLTFFAGAAALLLAGCGSNHDAAEPEVKVTDLAAGVYAVSSGDAANPTAGKYYAAADGSRLLVLNNSNQQAAAVYRRDAGGPWRLTPAPTADSALELLNSNAATAATLSAGALARGYSVRLASGAAAAFSINAGGDIVAAGAGCKLSGKVSASSLPNTLKLSLAASGCGDLPAQSDGYLVVDGDYAPAAFRLLTYSSGALVDLWAYAE